MNGRPRICKTGNSALRKALYMPALVALQRNSVIREFGARLKERGKSGIVIVVAVMRKLVVLAYTLLRRVLDGALPAEDAAAA